MEANVPKRVIPLIHYEKPRFDIPDPYAETSDDLKAKLNAYRESVFVDDYIEIKNILNEMKVLDPQRIQDEFVPKLKEIIANSNGRIEDFYLYPQHRPGGLDLIYDSGRRRYPKRLKEKKRKPEDRAIYLNGIEVGFMIARVPYLHTDCWGN